MRPMTHSDILRVAEIHTFARRMAFKDILSDKHLFVETNVFERAGYFEKDLELGERKSFVYDEGFVKGFLTLQPCENSCLQILRFYIDPVFQSSGIGSKMMEFCNQKAAEGNFEKICLWVLEQNLTAIDFYKTKGFMASGERKSRKYGTAEATQVQYLKDVKK